MKMSAFTIAYPPSYPWLYHNMKNCAAGFDKWYVVSNITQIMISAINQHFNFKSGDDLFKNIIKPYAKFLDMIKSEFPNVEVIDGGMVGDKLDACNCAYRISGYEYCNYLVQVDADEWYTLRAINALRDHLTDLPIGLYNLPETKYWKNFKVLKGGIWDSNPGRIYPVLPHAEIYNHRPPALRTLDALHDFTCNPKKINSNYSNGDIRCHHFNYVDPIQVMHKSMYFSLLRKDHPTYSKYFQWFRECYVPWNPKDNDRSKWKYHPSDVERVIEPEEHTLETLKAEFPTTFNFLVRYSQDCSVL